MKVPKGTSDVCSTGYAGVKTRKDRFSLLQIPDLVAPLGQDSERILKERDNNQETSNGRQMGF